MESQVQPKLIIHGGAGSSLKGKGGVQVVRSSLYQVVDAVYGMLLDGCAARDAVVQGCRMLEDDPLFNAGTGSVLQSDGQIRMSASLMDGVASRFSGVINVSRVQNPIELAEFLQTSPDRVLSDLGAAELVRELRLALYDPLTDQRFQEWLADRSDNFNRKMADVVSESAGRGTIGVVALDSMGRLAAGTSTGGKGFERIGRVSDSATPAGNYANANAGVSCTGIGEDILDECLAAKIVVRVTDGLSLRESLARSFAEAQSRNRDLGAIALDATGAIGWGKTSEVILAAFHDGVSRGDSLEAGPEPQVFIV
ncbi:MAG TPA: isoaspartyl peptidase/L-asparaginase [Oscillatoriaceae cyanobacterium M33_DOE_052]|uniref:Isoaspartyl peptidase n=1 Tax=Planktothricoides sp. SpSt-374 TaxID=2282167 RepID=A0A7C3ZZK6_9CYAN|nr:isoaspartyl peptidase/L-asparaginase [Oscillatoriaceae cyanobacterium M33_DOE_052]